MARLVKFTGAHGRPVAINPKRVDYAEPRSLRDSAGAKVNDGTELFLGNRTVIVVGEFGAVIEALAVEG